MASDSFPETLNVKCKKHFENKQHLVNCFDDFVCVRSRAHVCVREVWTIEINKKNKPVKCDITFACYVLLDQVVFNERLKYFYMMTKCYTSISSKASPYFEFNASV